MRCAQSRWFALDLDLDLEFLLILMLLPGWRLLCGVLPDLGGTKWG
jgi:hypothetical protein